MLSAALSKVVDSAIHRGATTTEPIQTARGIASLEQIDLNGFRQWILVRGHDASNPLLLFLHGGPGTAEIWFAHHAMRELEKHFVCVNWDQRGAGKSFSARPSSAAIPIAQFVDDGIALIERMLERFGQKKLLLIGHSWGSVLSMRIAHARPDLLHGVVGMGQIVDMERGEVISYEYALDAARRSHDERAIRQLEKIGPPPYKGSDFFIQRRWLSQFHGDTWSLDMKGVLSIGLEADEYSIADVFRFFRGVKLSHELVWNELMGVNFAREIPELTIPVFFFLGRHDYTTPFALAVSYFESLKAPSKKLVWFEDSAHMPNLEEPIKFQKELVEVGRELELWSNCIPPRAERKTNPR